MKTPPDSRRHRRLRAVRVRFITTLVALAFLGAGESWAVLRVASDWQHGLGSANGSSGRRRTTVHEHPDSNKIPPPSTLIFVPGL